MSRFKINHSSHYGNRSQTPYQVYDFESHDPGRFGLGGYNLLC
ncbi:MAG: hypothetical protein ACI9OI_002360, partial [Chitinophagales bacterium]